MRFGITLLFLLLISGPALAETQWVTQKFPTTCEKVLEGDPKRGDEGDWILYMCNTAGFPAMWQMYQEAVRQSIGFGNKASTVLFNVSTTRGDWPIVWGGDNKGGKFVPDVAIARFNFGVEAPLTQSLAIFKLLPSGMSCVVGMVEGGPRDNEKAKALAVAARTKWTCESEPQFLDLE
jgi:hypothetical protein